MIHPFDPDCFWWLIPVIGQATEFAAATAALTANRVAMIASQQSAIREVQFVPLITRLTRLGLTRIYFIPTVLVKSIKLLAYATKSITVKVFGSGQ